MIMDGTFEAPFAVEDELSHELGDGSTGRHVPSRPRVSLQDRSGIRSMLVRDFCSHDLDRIAKKLWCMSKQDSRNISPLHRQLVKRRNIIVTEDPKLHLVWIQDRIFIKPIPRYLTSHAFWTNFLSCDTDDDDGRARRAALGFLRTYYYLIQYESDFRIAQDPHLCLVPPQVTWEQFCAFTAQLSCVDDAQVSLRYSYGEVRLTRLNFYAPFFLGKSYFQRVDYQYSDYFARFFHPTVFLFAIVAVILGALQVIVSVGEKTDGGLTALALWTSVATIVVSCTLLLTLAFLLVYKMAKEWKVALRDRRQRKKTLDQG